MEQHNKEQEELVKKIIDKLLEDTDKLTSATHWGEPSMLLCDVINTINNVAGTDYKRYSAYGSHLKSKDCKPSNTNFYCFTCNKFFANTSDRKGCTGRKVTEENIDKAISCADYSGYFEGEINKKES